MKHTVTGLVEQRRNDDPHMMDFTLFGKDDKTIYLMCEDKPFGRKLRDSESVDVHFSNEGIEDTPGEDAKLLMLSIDEIDKRERYAIFVQKHVDIWLYVYFNKNEAMPRLGDLYTATVVFHKKGENDEV